uniref:Putative secreted protein n=1 Tax=Ixodes ricinus TaxID=34613 RepID=A0A6B0UA59_IXORI
MWASSTGRTFLTSFFSVGSCVSAFSSTGVFPFGFFAFFFWESGSSDASCDLYVFASSSSDPGTLSGATLSSSPAETPGVPSRLGALAFSVPGASKVLVPLKTSPGAVI